MRFIKHNKEFPRQALRREKGGYLLWTKFQQISQESFIARSSDTYDHPVPIFSSPCGCSHQSPFWQNPIDHPFYRSTLISFWDRALANVQVNKGKFPQGKKSMSELWPDIVGLRTQELILEYAHSLATEGADYGPPCRSVKAIPKESPHLNPGLNI